MSGLSWMTPNEPNAYQHPHRTDYAGIYNYFTSITRVQLSNAVTENPSNMRGSQEGVFGGKKPYIH